MERLLWWLNLKLAACTKGGGGVIGVMNYHHSDFHFGTDFITKDHLDVCILGDD